MRFHDRTDAGRQLTTHLAHLADAQPVILALPRGGVPVAIEVARALDAPLDVLGVRKVGAPGQPELGIGAIAEGGVTYADEQGLRVLGVTSSQFQELADREGEELRRRVQHYRRGRALPELAGRTAIVVDDGLATGVTAIAALRAVRALDAGRAVLAVPVCAPDTAAKLREEADEVVCVMAPSGFAAVGAWYEDFSQVTDERVVALLGEAASAGRQR